jgi:hypothetical protein
MISPCCLLCTHFESIPKQYSHSLIILCHNSQVSNQPTQTNSSFPILSSTQTPSDQPKLPETTLPQSPAKHSTHIPSMPTEPTLPDTPINPKVKLSPLTGTQLPSKLDTAAVHTADLAVSVIPYDFVSKVWLTFVDKWAHSPIIMLTLIMMSTPKDETHHNVYTHHG